MRRHTTNPDPLRIRHVHRTSHAWSPPACLMSEADVPSDKPNIAERATVAITSRPAPRDQRGRRSAKLRQDRCSTFSRQPEPRYHSISCLIAAGLSSAWCSRPLHGGSPESRACGADDAPCPARRPQDRSGKRTGLERRGWFEVRRGSRRCGEETLKWKANLAGLAGFRSAA